MNETSTGLRVGGRMQNFELPDQEGGPFELYRRLEQGHLVLVFYRGDW